jgi:hypothetical protein
MTKDPQFGSLSTYCYNFEGTEGLAPKISPEMLEVPPATPISKGAGSGDAKFWETEGDMHGGGSNKVALERLDLTRDMVANCSPGNAPSYRLPVPNRGALFTLPIGASLCKDWVACTVNVGANIDTKLSGANVQEAFHHLKGWHKATMEMQSKSCFHTMDCQTLERVNIYAHRQSVPRGPPPHLGPTSQNQQRQSINDEIWVAANKLSNGHAGGATGMCAEHLKVWLWGTLEKEDPEGQGKKRNGDNWHIFTLLVQAVWNHGSIPRQLLWIIVVLILKSGRDYHGIGLLEPIWKF